MDAVVAMLGFLGALGLLLLFADALAPAEPPPPPGSDDDTVLE